MIPVKWSSFSIINNFQVRLKWRWQNVGNLNITSHDNFFFPYMFICFLVLAFCLKVFINTNWWLVRVTLVVDWLFLPRNFGLVVRTYEGLYRSVNVHGVVVLCSGGGDTWTLFVLTDPFDLFAPRDSGERKTSSNCMDARPHAQQISHLVKLSLPDFCNLPFLQTQPCRDS